MKPEALLGLMHTAEALKNAPRHSWTSTGRRESVAEHSWRLALMALFAAEEYPGMDTEKLLKMCLLHDMGEAFTGDIPCFEKTQADETVEAGKLADWTAGLPAPWDAELTALFAEMDALQTPEAQLCKALDQLEAVLQHNEAPLDTWLPLEYELQLHHGEKPAAFSSYTAALRAALTMETRAKTAAAQAAE